MSVPTHHEQTQVRAYFIWQKRCDMGDTSEGALRDWLEAESEERWQDRHEGHRAEHREEHEGIF